MTILIVDDSRFMQLGIQKVLQQAGHSTILAADGEQAIATAIAQRPDVILLDIMLPGVPGTSVLKSLRHNSVTAAIPVVVLTGLSTLDGPKLKQAGADGYVKKSELDLPNGGQILLQIVNQLAGIPETTVSS